MYIIYARIYLFEDVAINRRARVDVGRVAAAATSAARTESFIAALIFSALRADNSNVHTYDNLKTAFNNTTTNDLESVPDPSRRPRPILGITGDEQ